MKYFLFTFKIIILITKISNAKNTLPAFGGIVLAQAANLYIFSPVY
jgi:hypothetical protein